MFEACISAGRQQNENETDPINGCCCGRSIVIQEHAKGRTRFEGDGDGLYDGADRRPNFLREFDLILFRIARDGR